MSEWFQIDVERCLYVDRGRDVILCDRLPSPVTLVVEMSDKAIDQLRKEIMTNSDRKRIDASLGGLKTPMMNGDNLAIVLCSYFDNPDQPNDDETGWTPDAVAGCDEVLAAIRAHYEKIDGKQ